MPTRLRSIRWRLPLSYIAVALLAALAAGVLMLLTLRGYYRQREHDYLQTNARQIGQMAEQLLQVGAPEPVLTDQITNWSFMLQVRVQVFGADGRLVADSGQPETRQVLSVSSAWNLPVGGAAGAVTDTVRFQSPMPGLFFIDAQTAGMGRGDVLVSQECSAGPGEAAAPPAECSGQPLIVQYSTGGPGAGVVTFTQPISAPIGPIGVAMPLAGSLYGFELETPSTVKARSAERVEQPLAGPAGEPLGRVVLSDGPAYGHEILLSALAAWAAASLAAMVLAGAAGAWVSRRITVPLLALTRVTESMTAGSLQARAAASAGDELGQLGRAFNAMAERVAKTVDSLRQFVADAAHELNTPLTALQTDLELAATAGESERGQWLGRAQAQVERLHALVAGLLDLSRIEGKPALSELRIVDLAALARAVSEPYASRAEQAGLAFELDLPAAPVQVRGDPAQLRRAVENLVDNAIKFTPAGGQVRLALNAAAEEAVVSVEDTGIGIPPEDSPLLFQRFHRGRNASGYPGNGLGLAIVQAIAQAHAGTVTVRSTPRGTCFQLHFPRPG